MKNKMKKNILGTVLLGVSLVVSGCGQEKETTAETTQKVKETKEDKSTEFNGNQAFLNGNEAEELALSTESEDELKTKLEKEGYVQPDYMVEDVNLATANQTPDLVTLYYYKVEDGYLSFSTREKKVIQKEGYEPSIVTDNSVLERLSSNGRGNEWRGESK